VRVSKVTLTRYTGSATGAYAAKRAVSGREGLLLGVVAPDGAVAQGEASPLPGYSADTIESVEDELRRLDFSALPEPGRNLASVLDGSMRLRSPSARFALETILVSLSAFRQDLPVFRLLGDADTERDELPLSVFVGSTADPDLVASARDAAGRGIRGIKVKLGLDTRLDLPVLEAVRDAIGTTRLRLDANQGLDPKTAARDLELLARLDPEWVEEPLPVDALVELSSSPVPIALDESLQVPGIWERLAPRLRDLHCVALVLKPMALGGFSACLGWAQKAAAHELDVSVSHLFDGPIALAAAAHLALAVGTGDRGQAVPAHAGLAAWPPLTLPFLGETTLTAPVLAGLGVALLPEHP
jgi:L-alanine-DL-glutamate epimerase-like enolase superfamily enzyme